jgi:hypothetical protein
MKALFHAWGDSSLLVDQPGEQRRHPSGRFCPTPTNPDSCRIRGARLLPPIPPRPLGSTRLSAPFEVFKDSLGKVGATSLARQIEHVRTWAVGVLRRKLRRARRRRRRRYLRASRGQGGRGTPANLRANSAGSR